MHKAITEKGQYTKGQHHVEIHWGSIIHNCYMLHHKIIDGSVNIRCGNHFTGNLICESNLNHPATRYLSLGLACLPVWCSYSRRPSWIGREGCREKPRRLLLLAALLCPPDGQAQRRCIQTRRSLHNSWKGCKLSKGNFLAFVWEAGGGGPLTF